MAEEKEKKHKGNVERTAGSSKEQVEEIIIDAKNGILGRIATFSAKRALEGKNIIVCNCDYIIIKGKQEPIISFYKHRIERGRGSQKGPYFPRTTERIARRTIRGMLPIRTDRGRKAFKRVMCFRDIPEKYASKDKITYGEENLIDYLTLKRVCELL